MDDESKHYYFPDFYIAKFNLIVEIKSSYILSKDPITVELKASATKAAGHKYIMILDKKYDQFKTLITELQEQIKNTSKEFIHGNN